MANKLDLRLKNPDDDAGNSPRGEVDAPGMPLVGIFAVVFGVLSIVSIAPLFVPLALICGVIAVLLGQVTWGLGGLGLAVIGVLTSPMILGTIGALGLAGWFL